jgi:TRAP-type C4-dicarboxylate transport system substrate-binding protein
MSIDATSARTTRRGLIKGAAALVAVPTVFAPPVFAPQVARAQTPAVTLRVHHFLPPVATVPSKFITPWARKVEADSGNRIKVNVFPAMQLGGAPPQLFDQARDGVVDMVWTLLGYTPGRFPKAEVFELPFIAALAEPTSRAAYRFYEKHLRDELGAVHVIAVHTHGPGLLHMTGNGVRNLDDMKGKRIRVPSRQINKLAERLGATPVGMPVPQVPEALAQRVIDGTVIPWEVTPSLRIAELTRTHTNFSGNRGLYTAMFVFAMNKARYEGLAPDLRAVIDANSGVGFAASLGKVMDEGDPPALAIARNRGNTIITLDAAETARWQERARGLEDEWVAEVTGRGHNGAQLLADAKAMIAEAAGAA